MTNYFMNFNKNLKKKKIKIFHADILKFDLEKIIKKNSIIFGTFHTIFHHKY